MRKHGVDGLLGKGVIFGFDLREKARSRPYNGRGGVGPILLLTQLSLHFTTQMIITTDACMDGSFFIQ